MFIVNNLEDKNNYILLSGEIGNSISQIVHGTIIFTGSFILFTIL